MSSHSAVAAGFPGRRIIAGAFVLAAFGWGLGFYGPPIYLHAAATRNGLALPVVSAAVTLHFLAGAALVPFLPGLYGRFGLPAVTRAAVLSLAVGLAGWAAAAGPAPLAFAAVLTGWGFAGLGATAVTTLIATWYVRDRPAALASAYNGASLGGVLFGPLVAALIAQFGFLPAALGLGFLAVAVVFALTRRLFALTPQACGTVPDGRPADGPGPLRPDPRPPLATLWRDRHFITLAAGMALGLFAQVGVLAHVVSLVAPLFGDAGAGFAIAVATGAALAGRKAATAVLAIGLSRRAVAMASLAVQAMGLAAIAAFGAGQPAIVIGALLLFGFGIGNATSLPPLIAQQEFAAADTPRVVARIIALAQACYAFAPLLFGLLRGASPEAFPFLAVGMAAITVQAVAIAVYGGGLKPPA